LPLYFTDLASLIWTGSCAAWRIGIKIQPLLSQAQKQISPSTLRIYGLGTAILLAGIAYGTMLILNKIYQKRAYKSLIDLTEEEKKQLSLDRPHGEKFKQFLYITRIIVNIALACVFPNPFTILSAVIEGYSLIKLAQRKWINFTKLVPIHFLNGVDRLLADQIKISYLFPLRSGDLSSDNKQCTICLQDTSSSTAKWFCNNHFFHTKCLINLISEKISSLGRTTHVDDRTLKLFDHYDRDGFIRYTTYSAQYQLTAQQQHIPSCPTCRSIPGFNTLSFKVHDAVLNEWSAAKMNWT
jgi:hypothetical protein